MAQKLGLFYNQNGLQGTLLGIIDDVPCIKRKQISKNDSVVFFDENDNIIGFNIANASQLLTDGESGFIRPTNELIKKIEQILSVDLSAFHDQLAFVVGEVVDYVSIPKTHLRYCKVDIGTKVLEIVCGANNFDKNTYVVVALDGAVMPDGQVIKKRNIRDNIVSEGMLCSYQELNLPHEANEVGIICLPYDLKNLTVGSEFIRVFYPFE